MKKIFSLLMVFCLIFGTASALAAGNVTIAVRGQNDFDDYISSAFVRGNKLLLNSYDRTYEWNKETGEMREVKGYQELRDKIAGHHLEEGEEPLVALEEGEYCNLYDSIYTVDDKIYVMAEINDEENNARNLLVELMIDDNDTFAMGETIDLGDALMVEEEMDGETYRYSRYLQKSAGFDGVLYGISYGENGMELLAIELESGHVNTMTLDVDGEIDSMTRYKDGQLLLTMMNYDSDPVVVNLVVYDVTTQETTLLGEMPRDGWQSPLGICYDEQRSRIYYSLAGSMWRIDITDAGLGTPEEFSDMPMNDGSANVVLMDDLYIMAGYDAIIGRDVTQEKMPEQHMRVVNYGYSEGIKQAYFSFTNAHPEYMVSISTAMDPEALMSNMMNRSSDVDIYTIDSTVEAFSALLNRGFMAELTGSEKIKAGVEGLYPFLKDTVMKDGEIYALPMNSYADTLTMNVKTLEKMGYTKDDLPKTWFDFYDMLQELPAKLEEFPEIQFCEQYMDVENARYQIFSIMLQDYFTWLDADQSHLTESGDVLVKLCEAYEKVDWNSLGMKESSEDESFGSIIVGSDDEVPSRILEFYNSVSFYQPIEGDEWIPLSVKEGEEPLIGMNVVFAFVNPFSENREAAIEYLEYAWDCVEETIKMQMVPSMNDPVENKHYEESLKDMEEYTHDLEAQLEKTEDEEEKEQLNQMLEEQKKWYEEYKKENRYQVSAEDIEHYRAFDKCLVVQKSSWWNASEDINKYLDGAMTAQQLATSIEKTMQMKRLEGN